jgi:transposase
MSLQRPLCRFVPDDTAQLCQALLPTTSPYRLIGDSYDVFVPFEDDFAVMYDDTGRGAVSPVLLSLVTVLQMLENVPDRMAAEYVVMRLDWKYALHLPLSYAGFHFSVLCDFRQRLMEHGKERFVFDYLIDQCVKLGFIKHRGKVRTDSTHILAVVERLQQVDLVTESLRVALKVSHETVPSWVERTLPAVFREQYQRPLNTYGMGDDETKRQLLQAGRDGFWFLGQIDQSAPQEVRDLAAVATLRTVLSQQFPGGPDAPPAGRRPTGGEVIESPHEPEARFATKRGRSHVGYKMQVTETYDEDRPRLIVDMEPTSALANDSPELANIQARLQERQIVPSVQQVDQAYMSGENMARSAEQGIELLGVPPADTQGPAGFQQADFDVDETTRQAMCPAGQTSVVWSERPAPEGTPCQVYVRFSASACQGCPHFGICTTSVQGRSLTLHPYRHLLVGRRAEAQTEAFKEKLHPRAGSEGTISELVRGYGLRQARYRGASKQRLQAYFTAAAANLKRLARFPARQEGRNGTAKAKENGQRRLAVAADAA